MLRTITDRTLDDNIRSYLLLNMVRVYRSGWNSSTRYNRDTIDFWGLFKIVGIYFVRVIRENSSYWRKSFVQYQHQCLINFAVPSETTLMNWWKKSLNIELKYKSRNIQFLIECILRSKTKELAWSCHLMGKLLATRICADGEENLSGSDRSPAFEEWK